MAYKVLYISYDGMTDPLGQSQVLPYLRGLSKLGCQITLVSFEKREKFEKVSPVIKKIIEEAGISWNPVFFSRRPPFLSKIYDVWKLKKLAARLYRRENFNFTHCRSYVPVMAGYHLFKKYNVPFLFDMRGFWVDERVDNGQWDLKKPFFRFFYNYYKRKEKAWFKAAKHIISLTWKGREELINHYNIPADKVTVIPCCVDLEHFDYKKISQELINEKKQKLEIQQGDIIISYLGSLGGWYLVKEMLDFFAEMKKSIPKARILFITQDSKGSIYKAAAESGVSEEDIIVQPAQRQEVPVYLSLSDFSIFFIKDAYSKRASSPTKQGEIMAMGIPLICNDIGDTGKIVESSGVGALVKNFAQSDYKHTIDQLPRLKEIKKEDIRNAAFTYYNLASGVKTYWSVYIDKLI